MLSVCEVAGTWLAARPAADADDGASHDADAATADANSYAHSDAGVHDEYASARAFTRQLWQRTGPELANS